MNLELRADSRNPREIRGKTMWVSESKKGQSAENPGKMQPNGAKSCTEIPAVPRPSQTNPREQWHYGDSKSCSPEVRRAESE